jgi:hypothetical protein
MQQTRAITPGPPPDTHFPQGLRHTHTHSSDKRHDLPDLSDGSILFLKLRIYLIT